jgi:hypothetical protein
MEIYGKCRYRNMENGFECGCLRSRVQSNDDYSCKACEHDLCYHENFLQTSLYGQNIRNNNRFDPHRRSITFKLICLFGGKPNQKIPR